MLLVPRTPSSRSKVHILRRNILCFLHEIFFPTCGVLDIYLLGTQSVIYFAAIEKCCFEIPDIILCYDGSAAFVDLLSLLWFGLKSGVLKALCGSEELGRTKIILYIGVSAAHSQEKEKGKVLFSLFYF